MSAGKHMPTGSAKTVPPGTAVGQCLRGGGLLCEVGKDGLFRIWNASCLTDVFSMSFHVIHVDLIGCLYWMSSCIICFKNAVM